jgi:putative ABC transport system permease protein
MFWRILSQLFNASRGRLAVALIAIASGAAVTTALLNLNWDAERKVSGEFRTLGPNGVILPIPLEATKFAKLSNGKTIQDVKPSNALLGSSLMPESILEMVGDWSEGNGIVDTPYLYIVASVTKGVAEQQVIVTGTWLARFPGVAPWWKLTGQPVADNNDSNRCLIGVNVAHQLGLAPGSQINLRYADPSGDRTTSLTVAGIVNSGGQEDNQVIANLQVVQKLTGLEERIGSIALIIPGDPAEIESDIIGLSAAVPSAAVRGVPQISHAEGLLLPRIRGLIFFMVALILVLTTLCVFATMAALAMERRRDVGLMKAIGGSMSRIVSIFLTEAGALGLAGALIGYVVGILLSRWIGERAFHVAISARPEVLPLVIALMVGVAMAGALPLRLLGNIRPAEIMRGE